MQKKQKFKPVITRVKLDTEQAVLSCACYSTGYVCGGASGGYQYVGSGGSVSACGLFKGISSLNFVGGNSSAVCNPGSVSS